MTTFKIEIEHSFNLGKFVRLCMVNAPDEKAALRYAKKHMWQNGCGMVKKTARAIEVDFDPTKIIAEG